MDTRIQKANQVTFFSLGINALLIALKITAGIFGHSTAIIADAFHSLSDFSTDIAVIWGLRAASQPADCGHRYGHGKIEAMVSMGISMALLIVGMNILGRGTRDVVLSLQGEILSRPAWMAFIVALASILMKEGIYRVTLRVGRDIESDALIANAWHHRSDALSSLGVLLGIGGAIVLGDHWRLLDPLAAVIVSVFILRAGWNILRSNIGELIDASLGEDTEKEILGIIRGVPGAERPHNLKTRRIGRNIAIEIHIRVDPSLNITRAHNISTNIEKELRKRFGKDTFISVHVEPLGAREP